MQCRRPWRYRGIAIAASLLIMAGGSAYLWRERISEVARLAAGDHQNCAVRFALREKPISLKEAAERFDPAYAQLSTTPPDTVRTTVGTLQVADRHSCVFDGRRFGHVVFTLDDHLVSVLMTRDDHEQSRSNAELSWLPRINGLGMASLHTSGHVVYVVSDLGDSDFRVVAQALAQPASRLAALTTSWLKSQPE